MENTIAPKLFMLMKPSTHIGGFAGILLVSLSVFSGCTSENALPNPHEVFCLELRSNVDRSRWIRLLKPLQVEYGLSETRGPLMDESKEPPTVWLTIFRGLPNFLSLVNSGHPNYYSVRLKIGDDRIASASLKADFLEIVRVNINPDAVEVVLGRCK